MTLSVFVFTIIILITGYFLISGLIDLRASRRLREIIRRQKTQREFGKLRNSLMMRLSDKEIDGRSLIFLHLYLLDTTVMRRPEGHKTLAGKLRVLFEKGIKRDEPVFKALIDERPTWPADVHGLVAQHSVELTSLMLRHSTVIRIAYLVAKTLGRTLTPTFRKMAFGCIDKLAGLFSPSTRAILNARNAMVDLVLNDNMIEIAV